MSDNQYNYLVLHKTPGSERCQAPSKALFSSEEEMLKYLSTKRDFKVFAIRESFDESFWKEKAMFFAVQKQNDAERAEYERLKQKFENGT